MPDAVDHAADFARLYPEYGAPRAVSENDVLKEAEFARRIAAAYWPRDFAREIGFDFSAFVYASYGANAFAGWEEGRHWIGMATGLIYALAELCMRIAAVFPLPGSAQSGPVRLAAADGTGFRFRKADFADPIEHNRAFFQQASQFSQVRMRVLNTLWLDCLVQVWRHEMFHAALGHTRFIQSRFGLRTLSERMGDDMPAPGEAETIAMLELHADWASFGSILRLSLSGMDPAGADLRTALSPTHRHAITVAAGLVLPFYFAHAERRAGAKPATHPSAAARLVCFLARIEELDAAERDVWHAAVALAVSSMGAVARESQDFVFFADFASDQALALARTEWLERADRFDEIQERLAPYAVLPLGHPHQGAILPLMEF